MVSVEILFDRPCSNLFERARHTRHIGYDLSHFLQKDSTLFHEKNSSWLYVRFQ